MCAIIDANVRAQVFGDAESPAGELFLDWLGPRRGGKLVVGGKLLEELVGLRKFEIWLKEAVISGRARILNEASVNAETKAVEDAGICVSNDPHIIALARISGARLLFTNDVALEKDFKREISQGKIYTTKRDEKTTRNAPCFA